MLACRVYLDRGMARNGVAPILLYIAVRRPARARPTPHEEKILVFCFRTHRATARPLCACRRHESTVGALHAHAHAWPKNQNGKCKSNKSVKAQQGQRPPRELL